MKGAFILVAVLVLVGCKTQRAADLALKKSSKMAQFQLSGHDSQCLEGHYDYYGNYYPRRCGS